MASQVAIAAELFVTLVTHVDRRLVRFGPLRPIHVGMLPVRDVVTVVGRRLAGVPKQVAGSRKSATAGGAFDGRCLLALNTAMQCIETVVGELLPARRAAADFESRRLRPR